MIETLQALKYLKGLPPIPESVISEKKVYVPPSKKPLVIFDLDETLIHCVGTREECGGKKIDRFVELKFEGEDPIDAGINIRPHLKAALDRIGKHF